MPLPTGTTRGSGLSRSEAAIQAWKKRQRAAPKTPGGLDPKIAARVKEILASKVKKPKGAKPKATKPKVDKAKLAADRKAAQAAKKEERDKAKAERLGKQMSEAAKRETAKRARVAERATAMAKRQQAQRAKLKQAARAKSEKAKANAAKQAASQQAKAGKDKANADKQAASAARKKRVLAEKVKRGEKLSASDQVDAEDSGLVKPTPPKARKALDMDDLAIKAGARHSKMDASHLDEAARHLHAAGATCPDCEEPDEDDSAELLDDDPAGKAIKGIMDNPQYYAQHECNDIAQAAGALANMAMLIQSELMEEDEDTAHVSMLCDGARTLVKFISAEIDELEGAADDAADTVRMGPMNKAVDDDAPWLRVEGGAVKAMDDEDDTITGMAILYATKATHDLERDYYDKNTDLWLNHWGWPRPITYHHGMDKDTRDDPVVGHWTKAVQTDEGVWLEGQLDRAHRYYKAVKELARRGYLKISSDSGPQWVIREPQASGVNYVKRWPLVTASVTVTPMEPRMMPVEVKAYLAELGYDTIDDIPEAINPTAVKADGRETVDSERARRMLLDLELLELEAA